MILAIPSLVAAVLTKGAMAGLKCGKKILLLPLLTFLMIVPTVMAILTLLYLVVQCKTVTSLLDDPSLNLQFSMNCLLAVFYILVFLGWLVYIFCTITIMARIVSALFHVHGELSRSARDCVLECSKWENASVGG
jgi:hypothetical protein